MKAKNIYLNEADIAWVEKEARLEARGFSNYLTKLIRDDKRNKIAIRTVVAKEVTDGS